MSPCVFVDHLHLDTNDKRNTNPAFPYIYTHTSLTTYRYLRSKPTYRELTPDRTPARNRTARALSCAAAADARGSSPAPPLEPRG